MTIELDGRKMTDRTALHDYLQEALELPDYYGRNLDALYDLLAENARPRKIVLCFRPEMEAHLGGYGRAFLKTLRQAAEENPALEIVEE